MNTKTLIVDNYDSFTFNLVQYVGELGGNPMVYRNDKIAIDDIKVLEPSHIILSPGPGDPTEKSYFGVCNEVIEVFSQTTPLLGVCLGHQGIAAHFGAQVINAPEVRHGKKSIIEHNSNALFEGIPEQFEAMRYHSLIIDRETLSDDIEIIATTTKDDLIMAIKHKKRPLWGIQFHPESIGTVDGKRIMENFLKT